MTDLQTRSILEELKEKHDKACEAAEESREALAQIEHARREAAFESLDGGEDARRKEAELDSRYATLVRELRRAERAVEEAEYRIGEEEKRLEQERIEQHERAEAELLRSRRQQLQTAEDAFGVFEQALRKIVLEVDPQLRVEAEALGRAGSAPAQSYAEQVIQEMRGTYSEKLERIMDSLVDQARHPRVRSMIAERRRRLVEAADELERLRREAGRIAGHSPMGRSGEAHRRMYEAERECENLERSISLLQDPERGPEYARQLEAKLAEKQSVEEGAA